MDSFRTACIVLVLFLNSGLRLCEEYVERQTEYGKIRGFVKEVLSGKFVEMFLGVPYASPPVSELRFEVRVFFTMYGSLAVYLSVCQSVLLYVCLTVYIQFRFAICLSVRISMLRVLLCVSLLGEAQISLH